MKPGRAGLKENQASVKVRADKFSMEGLRRKLHAAERAGPAASVEALRVLGRAFGGAVLATSPTDTNRYKRGWAQALNAAGLGPVAVPEITRSRLADELKARLELQLERFEARAEKKKKAAEYWQKVYANRYARAGRKDRWERDCAARRDRAAKDAATARKQAERAAEQLRLFDPRGLVVWGRRGKGGKLTLGEVATVRTKVYGGRGVVVGTGSGAYLLLHNLEPHASIVESSDRVVARAFSAVKRPGVTRRARDAAARRIQRDWRRAGTSAAR